MVVEAKMAAIEIYQLYAELKDYTPKIWRRFEVVSDVSIARLGYILMTLFEMHASHLFSFDVPFNENYRIQMAKNYSKEDLDKLVKAFFDENPVYKNLKFELHNDRSYHSPDSADATKALLRNTIDHVGERLYLTYDFGDNWQIEILLFKISIDAETPKSKFPRVLQGEGFGIVEDCGGVPGLENIAAAFIKKSGKAYRSYCEWLGVTELDLSSLNLNDMNFRLKKLPRIFSEIYEKDLAPTQQSIDIIMRKYRHD